MPYRQRELEKMGESVIGLTLYVLFLSSRLTHQQQLFNSSEVSVSTVTDSSASLLNTTATPQTALPEAAASQTPSFTPNCDQKFSCRNRCENESIDWDGLSSDPEHCHCDQACLKYHDCCADFARFCKPVNPVNQGQQNTHYTCTKLSTKPGKKQGIFMISTCAEDWKDEDMRSKCLAGSKNENRTFTSANILEDIPVTFLSLVEPGQSYRNIYCGLCNKVPNKYFLPFWKLKFRCNIKPPSDYNVTQALDFMLKYCPRRILEPHKEFKIRTCLPMVSTCSVSSLTEHKDGCLKGRSGVVFSETASKNYRNYHCLLCNGLTTNKMLCGPQESNQDIFDPKSFEIIMEFTPDSDKERTTLTSVTSTCGTGTIYDPHLEICRTGYFPEPSTAIRDKYRIKLWMYPTDDQLRSVSPNEFRKALCTRFSLDPSQIDEISIAEEDSSVAVAFNLYAGAVSKSQGNMTHQESLNVSALLSFNQSFEITIGSERWVVLRATQRQLTCVQSEEFLPGEFDLLPTGVAFVKKTGQSLPPNRFFLVKHDNTANESLFVCISKFTINCPFVLLPVGSPEYKIFDNKSLLHTSTGRLYKSGEYDLDDKIALICTNYTKVNYTNSSVQVTDSSGTDDTESASVFLWYFTIVGFSVSILTLILTIAIHFIFSELRSPLPGKNLTSLCVALFLAQFMWLLGSGDTDKPIFCTVMAAVLHYLFLVSFACTAIIAFDTRRTFSSQLSKAPGRSIGGHSKTLRFLTYTCMAWGGPLLFVGICFLLDYFQVVDIGYGNEKACWLVNSNAKIATFATPIACVLLYNVAAFSHTVWAINTTRKQTTRVKSARQDRRVVLKIYVRLFTLMGFTWFFSFSAEFIHKALMYPFVVLTTLQGVYIFMAFVCKTRVLKLMRDSFPRSRKDAMAFTQHTASTDCKSLPPYPPYRSETEETHM